MFSTHVTNVCGGCIGGERGGSTGGGGTRIRQLPAYLLLLSTENKKNEHSKHEKQTNRRTSKQTNKQGRQNKHHKHANKQSEHPKTKKSKANEQANLQTNQTKSTQQTPDHPNTQHTQNKYKKTNTKHVFTYSLKKKTDRKRTENEPKTKTQTKRAGGQRAELLQGTIVPMIRTRNGPKNHVFPHVHKPYLVTMTTTLPRTTADRRLVAREGENTHSSLGPTVAYACVGGGRGWLCCPGTEGEAITPSNRDPRRKRHRVYPCVHMAVSRL